MIERPRSYEFADFRIDEAKRLLTRAGRIVPLTAKVFDTLILLVRNRERVVPKAELMKLLWPGSYVEEGNLAVNISLLRKALEDSPTEHRFIVTLPGRGYRFVAGVREIPIPEEPAFTGGNGGTASEKHEAGAEIQRPPAAPASPPPIRGNSFLRVGGFVLLLVALTASTAYLSFANHERPTPTGAAAFKSLAVLPFKPLIGGGSDEYLGLGMADALITKLSGVRKLIVRPTSAILKYAGSSQDSRAAGREQHVDAVLEGTVERAGDSVRTTVRLINVRDGSPLWAYQCDEAHCSNVLLLQDLLSERIAEALLVRLTGDEKKLLRKHYTEDPQAEDDYARGRYFWNQRTPEGLRTAIEYFERAVRRDPAYALAYTGLADCYSLGVWQIPIPASEAVPKLKAAAEKAVALDDTLAEAHVAMASLRSFEWKWAETMAEHERAIALNPAYATARHWHSLGLATSGRIEEAIVEARRAIELDPLSPSIRTDLGCVYYLGRRYDEAIKQYRSTLELHPDFSPAHEALAYVYSANGMHDEAVAEMSKASHLGKSERLAGLGFVYAAAGMRQKALEHLHALMELSKKEYVPPYHFAFLYAGLRDTDRAIAALNEVYREHTQHVVHFKMEPVLDNLRRDPRFQDLIRRVGL